jgi:ketosteroid isomerase-like protein
VNTKYLALLIALCILMASIPLGVAQEEKKPAANEAIQHELQRLEAVWNNAHLAGDTAALDALWADELVVTVPKMPLFNKAQSLAIWRTGRMKFKRYETSDLGFRIFGDTAVVTGALVRERTFMDKEIHEDWRFTKVYVHRDGKWRVVAWHASEAPPRQ